MDLRELQKAYLDNLRQVTEEKLEIGSLIRTIISVDDGLVFSCSKNSIVKDPCDPCDPCAIKSAIRVRIKDRVKSVCKKYSLN